MNHQDLPGEISQPCPRPTKPSTNFKIVVGFCVVIPLILYIIMGSIAYPISYKQDILKTRGVAVEGIVVNLRVEPGKHGPTYHVDYKFQAPQGPGIEAQTYQNISYVASTDFSNLHFGETLPILYDPIDPRISSPNFRDSIHKTDPYQTARIVMWIATSVNIVPGVILLFYIILYYREKNIVVWGDIAPAKITDRIDDMSGKAPSTTIIYEFTDSGGKIVQGVRKDLPSKQNINKSESSRKLMDRITTNPLVLYNPKNSVRNTLYPPKWVDCVLRYRS
jgi:hypothetical protein